MLNVDKFRFLSHNPHVVVITSIVEIIHVDHLLQQTNKHSLFTTVDKNVDNVEKLVKNNSYYKD